MDLRIIRTFIHLESMILKKLYGSIRKHIDISKSE